MITVLLKSIMLRQSKKVHTHLGKMTTEKGYTPTQSTLRNRRKYHFSATDSVLQPWLYKVPQRNKLIKEARRVEFVLLKKI